MKMTKKQAKKHYKEIQKINSNFKGEIIFCSKANEYVVNDINNNLHLHISEHLEDLPKWEQEIMRF